MSSKTPGQLARARFMRNRPAVAGLLFLLFLWVRLIGNNGRITRAATFLDRLMGGHEDLF